MVNLLLLPPVIVICVSSDFKKFHLLMSSCPVMRENIHWLQESSCAVFNEVVLVVETDILFCFVGLFYFVLVFLWVALLFWFTQAWLKGVGWYTLTSSHHTVKGSRERHMKKSLYFEQLEPKCWLFLGGVGMLTLFYFGCGVGCSFSGLVLKIVGGVCGHFFPLKQKLA